VALLARPEILPIVDVRPIRANGFEGIPQHQLRTDLQNGDLSVRWSRNDDNVPMPVSDYRQWLGGKIPTPYDELLASAQDMELGDFWRMG
jgi:hypothetical protein